MKVYLEPDDIEKLEQAAKSLMELLLNRLLSRMGCRESEALGLSVEDVNFEEGTITIEHLKARVILVCPECGARLGKRHAFCPGCGREVARPLERQRDLRRIRSIPVDADTLALLREYIDRGGPVERDDRRLLFGNSRPTSGKNKAHGLATTIHRRMNPSAQSSSGTPQSLVLAPPSTHRLLVSPDNGGINHDVGVLSVHHQHLKDSLPYPSPGPTGETLVCTLPVPIFSRQMFPVSIAPQHPQYTIHKDAVVLLRSPAPILLARANTPRSCATEKLEVLPSRSISAMSRTPSRERWKPERPQGRTVEVRASVQV